MAGQLALLLTLGTWHLALGTALSAQIPPDARWRTLDTEHFRVSFVADLEEVARRAAERAERAYALLARELVEPPRGKIDLLLADNVDFANGYATPLPTNRIVLYAHAPVDNAELGFYEDWLELLILHELVHIFHLDNAGGVWSRLRTVFGRHPALFPSALSPGWLTEGLATLYESTYTRGGRLRGTMHDMVLRTAVLEDRFFPIDAATSDPVSWPAGNTRYVYGASFLDFLARRFGADSIPLLVERYGRQVVPFAADPAARAVFGESFSRAWREWRATLRDRYGAVADSLRRAGVTEPEILTRQGRLAVFPRYAPDGSALAYSASTGRDEPAIRLIRADGSTATVEDRTSLGPVAWTPDARALLFAQLEYAGPYRIYSDLFLTALDGDEERLTRAARIGEPDLHPDGARVVGVENAGASNVLVVRHLRGEGRRVLAEPSADVHWALPRWSPSGDRVAVARWTEGGLFDIVLLDSAGAVLREVTRDRAVDTAPAWSPDGRYLLFSSDRTGIPNLFALDLQRNRLLQVTNVLTGAFQPDVSPDGRWIALSYYRADGYHVARIPFDPSAWRPAPPPRPEVAEPLAGARLEAAYGGAARPYSPWPSVLPASWSAVVTDGQGVGLGLGVSLFGEDAIQRHLWSVEGVVHPDGARAGGSAAYRYRGWGNPVLDVVAGQGWSLEAERGTSRRGGEPLPSAVLGREREAQLSLLWLRRRWNSSAWVQTGGELHELDFVWDEPDAAGGRQLARFPLDVGATLGAGYSSARGYAFSLGPQEGATASLTLRSHRYLEPVPGAEGASGYTRLTTRTRAFQSFALPGFARHVLALRLDAGADAGSISPGFGVGGASGGASPLPGTLGLLGRGVGFPIRGYPEGVQRGNRAVVSTAEYRFPLLLVERGFRALPIFVERVWGDVFLDAGTAWCAGGCERRFLNPTLTPSPLAAAGAEANLDLQLGFGASLPLRFGVAVPFDAGRDPEVYVRVGRSF